MFKQTKIWLLQNPMLLGLSVAGFLIQVVTSITQVGFFHPDQHFQLLEFSSLQLQLPNAANNVWELKAMIRPTLLVYLFSGYRSLIQAIGITDPYTQMTMLRLLLSIPVWFLFNFITIDYLRKQSMQVMYVAILLLNFTWCFPFVRSLFSSEITAAFVFFGTVFWYHKQQEQNRSILALLFTGFLLAMSFYLRFQMGFAIVGFGVWWLLVAKKYKHFLPLALGFVIGLAINTWLDKSFYQQWVCTPYQYYYQNIVMGKAAGFGTSSFIVYIAVLIAAMAAPPLGFMLFWYGLKSCFKQWMHPIIITVLFFIVGHCLVGHKEERFLYPVFNLLPLIIGLSLSTAFAFYRQCKPWVRYLLNTVLLFSCSLNFFLLAVFMITPYSQTVYFSYLIKNSLKDKAKEVYCIQRTPYETESLLPLAFYEKNAAHPSMLKVDSIGALGKQTPYVITTFNQARDDKFRLDSLGYKQIAYSSKLLWSINEFLYAKNINSINDIWVLYKKEN